MTELHYRVSKTQNYKFNSAHEPKVSLNRIQAGIFRYLTYRPINTRSSFGWTPIGKLHIKVIVGGQAKSHIFLLLSLHQKFAN